MSEKTMLPEVDPQGYHEEATLLQYTLPTTRNLFDPESAHFLHDMLPEAPPLEKDPGSPYRIAEYTPGEALGSNFEIQQRIPKAKSSALAFIPLEIAINYVRKITDEMKRLDHHYKEELRQLVRRCAQLETDMKAVTALNTQLQAANEKNEKTFSNVTQMRIEFANYRSQAESTLDVLKEEVRTLLRERSALRAEVEKQNSATTNGKEKDEEIIRLKKELQDLEPAKEVKMLMEQHEALQMQLRAALVSKAKVHSELQQWTEKFERKHQRMPSQKDFNPVVHLRLQDAAAGDALAPVVTMLEDIRSRLLNLGFSIPKEEELAQALEERDSLRPMLQRMKSLTSDLERARIEKKAVEKELDDLKRLMAVPHRTDPEVSALRAQVEYLSSELTTFKGKSFALEIENRELQEQLTESQSPKHKSSFRSENMEPLRFDLDIPHRKKERRYTRNQPL